MKVFGRLLTAGVTVVVMVKSGDKTLKQRNTFWALPNSAALKGNYFQWRWNEHDKWKVENSHGHTTAGI